MTRTSRGPLIRRIALGVVGVGLIVAPKMGSVEGVPGPALVVAFALAGRVDIDLTTEPLGHGSDGGPVMLADIWPSSDEIRRVIPRHCQAFFAIAFLISPTIAVTTASGVMAMPQTQAY